MGYPLPIPAGTRYFYRRDSVSIPAVLAGIAVLVLVIAAFAATGWAASETPSAAGTIAPLLGDQDAVLAVAPNGSVLISINQNLPLIPASTLKLLTALVAFEYLGPEYRFPTDFFLSREGNLVVKGYGDPLLISEVVSQISGDLATVLSTRGMVIENLIVDGSYFQHPLVIPGVTSSYEPYDAPNGALCVNFNTIYFKKEGAHYSSAEPQTPLLPFVLSRIEKAPMNEGRIILSGENDDVLLYAGHLFAYFMKKSGIRIFGNIQPGGVDTIEARRIHRYESIFTVREAAGRLLEYSNNFSANQLLIASGARAYGEPGTLEKGVRAATEYAGTSLGITNLRLVEGSGISRENRMSAAALLKILDAFKPYRNLLHREGDVLFKTGTLHGIQTRAGYVDGGEKGIYPFVILINSKGKSADRVMKALLKTIGHGE